MTETRRKVIPFLIAIPIVALYALYSHHARPARRADLNRKLQAALDKHDAHEVRRLLHSGADPNGEETPGYTAIMQAVEHGDAESLRALLDTVAQTCSAVTDRGKQP